MSIVDSKMNGITRIYLAAPLFSEAERVYNVNLSQLLEKYASVYLPQRDGGLMSEMIADGIPASLAARRVFHMDMKAIEKSDLLIAILDGRAIDEGVAFEIGIAYSLNITTVGLQTDSRRLASWGNNPMITAALNNLFHSIDELFDWLRGSKQIYQTSITCDETG